MKKLICALIGTAALVASATTYIQTSSTGVAPWKPVKDSVSRAHLADSALKADSSRAAWKADSARIAWFAHAATYADSSRITHRADSSAYADSSRASHISDSTKKIPGSTIYRYLMTQANRSVSAGALYDSAGKLFSPESLVVGTQSSSATIGVNSRNSVITGYYMMDANKKRWGLARGALSDSFLLRAYTPSEAVIDTPLAFGVNAGDSGRITRPFKFSSGLRVLGGIAGNAATATKLAAARTIGMSGDVVGTATAFDGTANITIPTTLPTLLTAGSAGSATSVPTLTWDPKGRLIAAGSATISIPHTQISDWTSTLAGYQPLNSNLTQLSGGTNGLAIVSNVGAINYFSDVAAGDAILRWGTPYTETVRLGVMSISSGSNASSLWFNANSAGSNYAFSAPSFVEGGTALSSKYLGINASIPSSRISDWGTYINQPLLTTSSPTFGNANIGTMIGYPTNAWFGYSGLNAGTNYSGFYQTNMSDIGIAALSGHGVYLQVAQTQILDILGNGIIAHQPISANGGIAGNLTGTASNASALGGVAADYFVQGTGYDANSTFGRRTTSFNRDGEAPTATSLTDPLKSGFYDGAFTSGQTPNSNWAFVINTSYSNSSASNKFQFQLAAGFGNKHDTADWGAENYWMRVINDKGVGDWRTLLHSDNYPSFNNFTSGLTTTTLTASGSVTAGSIQCNGTFSPAVNSPGAPYTITASDQGKMVISINQLNLPASGIPAGFWCIVNWHVGGGTAKFGPTASGTAWNLRGNSINVSTSMPFTGIVSWDGYNWYAN